jgi:hypothetical protein
MSGKPSRPAISMTRRMLAGGVDQPHGVPGCGLVFADLDQGADAAGVAERDVGEVDVEGVLGGQLVAYGVDELVGAGLVDVTG